MNKPVFILLHQVLEGTAEYIECDLVGEQDQALKDVLKKHPNGVLLTGHIHSGIDRADIYKRDWGFLYDMPSFKYVYAVGDSHSQLGF